MIKKINLLLFLTSCFLGFTQKKTDSGSGNIQLSKELKEKYIDDDIAILSYIEEITFDYNKKTDKVTVSHQNNQNFINLSPRSEIPIYIFYDNQSSLKKIKVKNKDREFSNLSFKDEYYNTDELFHTDARIKWKTLNFPLQGYTSHFSYEKKYHDVKYFISTYFDDKYPIHKKTVIINVPDWLELEIKEINFNGLSTLKEKSYDEKNKITSFTYHLEDLKAASKSKNAPGPTYYRPHLLFLAKSYQKNGSKNRLLKETKDLYKWYHSLIKQVQDDPEIIKEKTASILENCKTDEEKIKAIYYWVQDNIRYIAFEDGIAGFKPEEAQIVYKKKYGDCKGMANLTKQMLKIAGFDARLTWIGTKRIAYDYSLPTIAVDNHMICTVISGDKKYFLDSTEKFSSLDHNAERIQNKQVLIEDGENYILDKIPSLESIKNNETFVGDFVIDKEQLIGKISRQYKGESKSNFLYNINNLKTDRKEQALEWYIRKDDKNSIVSDIHVTDIKNRDGDLYLTYSIDQKNAVSSFENELYIDIDYYKEYKNLDLDDRTIDYMFPYKIFEKTSINLEIPDNYIIKELPENLNIKNEDFEISFNYKTEGNKIKYEKVIHFKNAKISMNTMKAWNSFFNNLKEQYQKQIILTKG